MRIEPPPDPRAKLAMPVSALMASDAQLPAGLSPPSPQFRKNLWPLRNHRPELDFWRCQQFFRNWGQDGAAGGYSPAGLPEISGGFGDGWSNGSYRASGAFHRNCYAGGSNAANGENGVTNVWDFLASRSSPIYGRSDTVTPANISQPVILYLGRPA